MDPLVESYGKLKQYKNIYFRSNENSKIKEKDLEELQKDYYYIKKTYDELNCVQNHACLMYSIAVEESKNLIFEDPFFQLIHSGFYPAFYPDLYFLESILISNSNSNASYNYSFFE